MKKNGFSLAELLISMAIISFMVGVAITTFKTYDKGISHLYSNMYYVLDRALYNTTTYWIPNDAFEREPFKKELKNPKNGDVREISDTEGARRLCRALIEYINPVESGNRDSICSASKAVTDMGNDDLFTKENVMFTATNGVRFWISKRYPEDDSKLKFYIIYADMNGPRLPNSMKYEKGSESNNWKTKDPDIFAFAALENGRVCPLGIPEVEPRYMTTRIIYQDEGDVNDFVYKYSSPSRPYVYSKAEAWGYYLPQAQVPENHSVVADDDVIGDEPTSYNGYVRSNIDANSKIYEFLEGKTMSEYVQNDPYNKNSAGAFDIKFQSEMPRHENDDKTKPNIGGYGCYWRSAEECYVLIDKYVD